MADLKAPEWGKGRDEIGRFEQKGSRVWTGATGRGNQRGWTGMDGGD
jgi:hypothetical protein